MLGSFLPPVLFEVQANATQAIATFGKVNTQLKTMEAQAIKTGKALSGFQKAAVAGTAALKVLAGVAVVSMGIGVKAVMDLEKSMNRLGQAMANVGVSTAENRKAVAELVDSYENLGFGSEKAADAYSVLITATGNVAQSNRLLALSADLARAKNMSMEEAARSLIRAQNGNARVFKEFGIVLDSNKPKAQAVADAMAQLEQRLGGQAQAYAKTFAGQVAILNENLGDLFEAIGMKVLPVLNKFVSGLNNTGSWVRKNSGFVIALAAAITVALIPATVELTKKLAALAVTLLKSPIFRMAAVVFALAYGFVQLYNKMEPLRNLVLDLGTVFIAMGRIANQAFKAVYWTVAVALPGAFADLMKTIGKYTHIPWIKNFANDLNNSLDSQMKKFDDFDKKLAGYQDNIASLKSKGGGKITLNWDFKIPQIPGFDNGKGLGDTIASDIQAGLDRALQAIKDFNDKAKSEFDDLGKTWKSIVTTDFNKAVQDILTNPVDELIIQAQRAVNSYQEASNSYNAALTKLTKAQDDYTAAVKTGNEKNIMAAESTMRKAEDLVNSISGNMRDALADIKQLQGDMIKAIADSYKEIGKLETERTKILKEAQKEREELETQYNIDVAKIRKQYDKDVLTAQEAAATRSAEIVKRSVDQLRGVFKTATYRTVGDIFSALTFEGRYMKGGTTEKILAALGLQSKKAKTLAEDAATLAGLGFSQTFIEEVVAQGPDVGHQLAQTIIKSTPESIKQMQDYWNNLQSVSTHGVDTLAKKLNSGITLATEELTAELANVQVELNKELKGYDEALTESLKDAFDAYSKALDGINNRTAEQISAIDLQIAQLQEKIRQLKSALASLATLQAPGVVATAPNIIPTTRTVTEERAVSVGTCPSGKGKFSVTYNEAGVELNANFLGCVIAATSDGTTEDKPIVPITPITPVTPVTPTEVTPSGFPEYFTAGGRTFQYGVGTITSGKPDDTENETRARQRIADIFATITGQGRNTTSITINANTSATAQSIADDVGWAIRTSGDVQYRTTGRGKMVLPD